MHGYHQAAAGSTPAAAATPGRRPSDDRPDAEGLAMDLFVDLASGWTCWLPRWPNGAEPAAKEAPTAAARRPRGQGRVVGLLGRVGAWLGAPCRVATSAHGHGQL